MHTEIIQEVEGEKHVRSFQTGMFLPSDFIFPSLVHIVVVLVFPHEEFNQTDTSSVSTEERILASPRMEGWFFPLRGR